MSKKVVYKRIILLSVRNISLSKLILTFFRYFEDFELKAITFSIIGIVLYCFCIYTCFRYDYIILKTLVSLTDSKIFIENHINTLDVEYYEVLHTKIIPEIELLKKFYLRSSFENLKYLNYVLMYFTTVWPLFLGFFSKYQIIFSVFAVDEVKEALNILPDSFSNKRLLNSEKILDILQLIAKRAVERKVHINPIDYQFLIAKLNYIRDLIIYFKEIDTVLGKNELLLAEHISKINEITEVTNLTSLVVLAYTF